MALVDENGNIFEMHRYSLSEVSDFTNTTTYINNRGFYLENNDIVLSNFDVNYGNSLRVYFYMRPNYLVVESKGATVDSVTLTSEVDQINPKSGSITSITSGTPTIVGSSSHGLQNGQLMSKVSHVNLKNIEMINA